MLINVMLIKKTCIPSGSATAKLFSKLPMNKADEGSLQEINNKINLVFLLPTSIYCRCC